MPIPTCRVKQHIRVFHIFFRPPFWGEVLVLTALRAEKREKAGYMSLLDSTAQTAQTDRTD
jgi:hypothetical protein